MRALALLASASVVLLAGVAACDDARKPPFLPEASPTVTAEATPTAQSTPSPTAAPVGSWTPGRASPDFENFRTFAQQIEVAVRSHDTHFFINNAVLSSIPCPNIYMTECDGTEPTTIEGVWVGLWESEAFPEPPERFRDILIHYFASNPNLQSLAAVYRDVGGAIGGPAYFAITAIPSESASTQVFEFQLKDGAWRFWGMIHDGSPSRVWLSGECDYCYDYWERWEGAP